MQDGELADSEYFPMTRKDEKDIDSPLVMKGKPDCPEILKFFGSEEFTAMLEFE